MTKLSIIEIMNAVATLILAGLIAWSKFKSERGSKSDPSCGREIESRLQSISQELNHFKWCLDDIRERVMKLELSLASDKK